MKPIEGKDLNKMIATLGGLKAAGIQTKSIKDELRDNLIENLKKGINVFEEVHGFENSVIPELERAILSKHHINFLGYADRPKPAWRDSW